MESPKRHKGPLKEEAEALVDEVPQGPRRVDDEGREQLVEGLVRRDFLGGGVAFGLAAGLSALLGYSIRDAQGAPGDAGGGTVITDTDVDAKRIAGVRIATEFTTGPVPAGTAADPYPVGAIQAAIDDLGSAGGEVYIPAGLWKGTTPLSITLPTTIAIRGATQGRYISSHGTAIQYTGTKFFLDTGMTHPGAPTQGHVSLSNFHVIGGFSSNMEGIRLSAWYIDIKNVNLKGQSTFTQNSAIGFDLHASVGSSLINCDAENFNIGWNFRGEHFVGNMLNASKCNTGFNMDTRGSRDVVLILPHVFDLGPTPSAAFDMTQECVLIDPKCETILAGETCFRFTGGHSRTLIAPRFTGDVDAGATKLNVVSGSLIAVGQNLQDYGTAIIASGTSSVVVAHRLIATPKIVMATGRDIETDQLRVSARDGTNMTLAVPANVTADRTVDWYAEV